MDVSESDASAVQAQQRPASAGAVATVAGLRVQATRLEGGSNGSTSITSRFFSRPSSASTSGGSASKGPSKQLSPQDVGDLEAAMPVKKRSLRVVDDDDDDDDPVLAPKRQRRVVDDEASTPVKPRKRRSRVIVESDGEEDGDDDAVSPQNDNDAVRSDVSSPMEEDDVYLRDLKLKQERSGGSVSDKWMETFGRERQGKREEGDGWINPRDRSNDSAKRTEKSKAGRDSPPRARRRTQAAFDDDEDDVDADHHTRSHDEVGQILQKCQRIAEKLQNSLNSWSPPKTDSKSTDSTDSGDEPAGHVSLSSIVDAKAGGRRIVSQSDIPNICETLELKPYQVVGLNWLLLLCENGLSGVLADEMGLGKTVQTISFLLLLDALAKSDEGSSKYVGPHLVIVPASVLNNWKRELAWIAPTLRAVVYHGSKDIRIDLQETLTSDDFDVLLTTYTYFERDTCQDDRNFLRSFKFGYMILDEGHSIKNSKSSRFRRISALRARNRLVLSGTPIQNNLNELLALLSFLMPKMFDHGSDELLSFFDGNEEKKCAKIRKILAPFILRREKKYVLNQLVPKTVSVNMVQLPEKQRKIYNDLVESVIKQKEDEASRKEEEKARKKNKSRFDRQVQLLLGDAAEQVVRKSEVTSDAAIFTQLRKAANHPVLLRNHYASEDVLDTLSRCLHRAEAFGTQCSIAMVRKEIEGYSDFELHDLCVQYGGIDELKQLQLPIEALLESAKFDLLRDLLPKLKTEGHRVLIFSQWTKLLDLLEVLMSHMDYRYLRLDGSTEVAERQGLIDTYNQDTNIFVFLLSTRAGGLGINLTAADTVILHDLDFNPTNDEQACDRCHRIGQTKPVSIYKLVSEDTVDHDIYRLGESKTQLNNAVLGKLNAHRGGASKTNDNVTVEMLLASALSSYKKQ
ncbi:hypothetical protein PINS_up009165 [Pythium insidiosum]|nr:hypothetical protein PINS_up009165 [Pythium insidiosum]